MLKLNRKTEYALLAIRYLSERRGDLVASVRAISEYYSIPEPLLAKVLQRLKQGGFLASTKGSGGGYRLAMSLDTIMLSDVLEHLGEQRHLVDCLAEAEPCACQQEEHCDIRTPVAALNELLLDAIRELTLASFFAARPPTRPIRELSIYRSV